MENVIEGGGLGGDVAVAHWGGGGLAGVVAEVAPPAAGSCSATQAWEGYLSCKNLLPLLILVVQKVTFHFEVNAELLHSRVHLKAKLFETA